MVARAQQIDLTLAGGLLALGLVACQSTSLDAIVPQKTETPVMPSEMPPEMPAEECSAGVATVAAGLYRLRSVATGKCLIEGAPTTVLGTPGHLTALVEDCTDAASVWRLKLANSGPPGTFYEVGVDGGTDVLDIETGQTTDGTRLIVYMALKRTNQMFEFRERAPRIFEMAPGHVLAQASCISTVAEPPEIWRCDDASVEQEWQLLPADCE